MVRENDKNNQINLIHVQTGLTSSVILFFWIISGCASPTTFPIFEKHLIDSIGSHLGQTDLADIANDGDLDICSGGGPLSGKSHKIYIWENTGSRPKSPGQAEWIEHIIADVPSHEAVAGDIDGDGDIDICTKPWTTGNTHFFLENKLNK